MTVYDNGRSPHLWMKALDIASRGVYLAEPCKSALEQFYWMTALDFDISFVKSSPAALIVHRDQLANANRDSTLADWTRPLPNKHCFPADLSLSDAFSHLEVLPWLLLTRDDKIEGIITRDDLEKPAGMAFVHAHLVNLERLLRQLVGTYTNHPISDGREMGDAARVYGEVVRIPELLAELGWSEQDFRAIGAWVMDNRTRFSNAEHPLHENSRRSFSLPRFLAAKTLMLRAIEIIEKRDQVWSAFSHSLILDSRSRTIYAGPDAVNLPFKTPCFVITAYNPQEQVLDPSTNRRRNDMLLKSLELQTDKVRHVVSQSRCERWKEESFLVAEIEERVILAFASKYGQRAVYRLDDHELFVVDAKGVVRAKRSRTQ
ncbi:hypothetical protein Q31b_43960 [Novipirellula aureliae]|uniref:DUF3293 domain-containing protein n=1 Tax=Novipirellula aureliae TaxID=2527966 RepID=A0A5C6DLF6_9BACT|nr:DUF3293 domain-containing protein [Novipirellula aureliae]TWU37608.1 hypothetical protein Q31b_43960 [Novipirellula aureliae]